MNPEYLSNIIETRKNGLENLEIYMKKLKTIEILEKDLMMKYEELQKMKKSLNICISSFKSNEFEDKLQKKEPQICISDIFMSKNKNKIIKFIPKNIEESFLYKDYLYLNKDLNIDDIHNLKCQIYIIYYKKEFDCEKIISKDIQVLMEKSIEEIISLSLLKQPNFLIGMHEDDLKSNVFLDNILKLCDTICINCYKNKKSEILYNKECKILNSETCFNCNFPCKENAELTYYILLIKYIPYTCTDNCRTGEELMRKIIGSNYIHIAIYYYSEYIFNYIKNQMVFILNNNNEYYIKFFINVIKALYSKVNELFIDKDDKYSGLLSIEILHQYMGYSNKNIKINYKPILDDSLIFNFFKLLVDNFVLFEDSILFDLHVLNVKNYGKDKHIEYLYSKYPAILSEIEKKMIYGN